MTQDRHLARQAERHLDEVGRDRESLLYDGRWFTSGELFDRTTRIAGGLREHGVAPGDRVVAVMANSPDVGILYSACWRAGAVATPAMFLLPPAELRHIVTDAEARLVVVSPEFLGNVQAAVDGLDVAIVVDATTASSAAPLLDAGDHALPTLDDLAGADPSEVIDRDDDDLAALMYTGGTTGRSKGVMLTHANLWHAGWAGHEATREDGLKRTLVPLPLAHAFGLLVTSIGLHSDPDQVSVLMRWFEPNGVVSLIAEHRLDQATLVPTMLKLLLSLPLEEHDLSSLQRVVCGSAPLPAETRQAFEARVPSVTVCEGYGLTETTGAATSDRMSRRREGTVGQALPGIELRIVDATTASSGAPLHDAGEDVPTGEPGEVLVGGRTVSPGYWHADDASDETFFDDPGGRAGVRWCRTGDIGSLDEDGYLTIVDRKKDLIIRGGFNIYPRDVEDALHEHPAVATAGVVGRPDDTYGEEVVAFVTPQPGAEVDPEEVRVWARERLGPKSYPREVRVIEALPLTPVMKLDRKQLRTML